MFEFHKALLTYIQVLHNTLTSRDIKIPNYDKIDEM